MNTKLITLISGAIFGGLLSGSTALMADLKVQADSSSLLAQKSKCGGKDGCGEKDGCEGKKDKCGGKDGCGEKE